MRSIWLEPTSKLAIEIVLVVYWLWWLLRALRLAFDTDLRKIPGPIFSSITYWPLKLAVLSGRRVFTNTPGPFVRISPTEIAVADFDAWRQIHRIGSDFRKNPKWYQMLSPIQYDDNTCSVFALNDPRRASARRKLYQPVATRKVVAEWEPQIVQLVDLTVGKIKRDLDNGIECDIMKWWAFLTADVLGELAFGESFDNVKTEEKSQMIRDVETSLPIFGIRPELPWLFELFMLLPIPPFSKIPDIYARFDKYSRKAVENTRLASKGLAKTLFSRMVPEDGSQALPDSVIEQEAINAMFAGIDTTTITLTYLVYAVLRDDAIKQKLLTEIQAGSEHPTWEQLEDMPYLNSVIQETLRRYPVIPGSLPRVVPFGGVTFDKYFVPAGMVVSTQAYTFHRDPQVYEDPLRFSPDRWLYPTTAMKEHLMAFGGPVRKCLGENIARLEMLHTVVRFFRSCSDVRLAPNTTEKSMEMVDYFAIKPKAGVCLVESQSQ